MNQTISFITLGVADLARSRAFYQALGWQESSASQETIAFFQAGSVAFALFQREALAEDAAVPSAGSGFSAFTLAHNVASEAAVIATLDEAVAVGAAIQGQVLAGDRKASSPGRQGVLGGLSGLFCRPRWLPVGSLFQPFCGARCRGFR